MGGVARGDVGSINNIFDDLSVQYIVGEMRIEAGRDNDSDVLSREVDRASYDVVEDAYMLGKTWGKGTVYVETHG